MYRTAVATLVAFALAGGAQALAGEKKGGDKKFLLDVQGKVSEDDPKYKDKLPYKVHKLKLDKGNYIVELMATTDGFDPYVIVEDDGGKVVGADDDGGAQKGRGKLDSWLLLKANKDGEYKIHAASFTGAGGGYHL